MSTSFLHCRVTTFYISKLRCIFYGKIIRDHANIVSPLFPWFFFHRFKQLWIKVTLNLLCASYVYSIYVVQFSSVAQLCPALCGPMDCTRLPCPLYLHVFTQSLGFPSSSAGKESSCNAADPSLIPGWGRSLGEGIGYSLQYSWASPVAQMIKNPPAVWETWVRSLGWEDPLKEGLVTHSSILARRIPMDKKPGRLQSMGLQRIRHDWVTKHSTELHREFTLY